MHVMFFSDMLAAYCLSFYKKMHISDVLYFKDLVYVRINKTRAERTAVSGGGGSKAGYNGQ